MSISPLANPPPPERPAPRRPHRRRRSFMARTDTRQRARVGLLRPHSDECERRSKGPSSTEPDEPPMYVQLNCAIIDADANNRQELAGFLGQFGMNVVAQ